ncbi:MAG TPA: hypothetical protein VFY17_01510 [Pilimelia sp.]|nr:hypothetical protein [Pilimelia sp.]
MVTRYLTAAVAATALGPAPSGPPADAATFRATSASAGTLAPAVAAGTYAYGVAIPENPGYPMVVDGTLSAHDRRCHAVFLTERSEDAAPRWAAVVRRCGGGATPFRATATIGWGGANTPALRVCSAPRAVDLRAGGAGCGRPDVLTRPRP